MLPSTFGGWLLELWPPLLVALGVLAGMALLATIGAAQWLVLRRYVDGSGVWVVANVLAWIAGLVVVFAAIGSRRPMRRCGSPPWELLEGWGWGSRSR